MPEPATPDKLYKAATALAIARFPSGFAGAAPVQTPSGKIFTSIAPDVLNDALNLCMEVGALLEAEKFNEQVTHSLCVVRENEKEDFSILSPCGICQERLLKWGRDVQVAISNEGNNLIFRPLRELTPHHWSMVNT